MTLVAATDPKGGVSFSGRRERRGRSRRCTNMTSLVETIDHTIATSAVLRRQAGSFLRLAQEPRPPALVAELLALVACLEERAISVRAQGGPETEAERAMLRALV